MYYASRIAGVAALAAMGIAVWYSIVLARADAYFRAGTPASVERAVEIAPRNTEYLALRALQLEYDGGDSRALNEKIAELNPLSSAPRIRLGLAAEIAGNPASAERWLLEAAGVDNQFEPRWTLANFYFRAGKYADFWKWMRSALDVSYGDRTPSFDLCWRASSNAAEILRRAIPDRHDVVAAYLIYLSATKRLDAMLPVARRLAAYRNAWDLPLLYGIGDELLEARDPAALDVWLLTGESAPNGIFNGDFRTIPLNHGFDWRPVESQGVTHVNLSAPAGHRIEFNGQQPESCSLLRQTLNLNARRRYVLHWETRTSGIEAPSGLEWRITGEHAAIAPSEDWSSGELSFSAPAPFDLLDLVYQRPLGETRADGNVELRHVRLTEAAP